MIFFILQDTHTKKKQKKQNKNILKNVSAVCILKVTGTKINSGQYSNSLYRGTLKRTFCAMERIHECLLKVLCGTINAKKQIFIFKL